MRMVEINDFSFENFDLLGVLSSDEEGGHFITLMRWDADKTSLQFDISGDILLGFTDVLEALKPKGRKITHAWPGDSIPRLYLVKEKGTITIRVLAEDLTPLELAAFTRGDYTNGRIQELVGWLRNCREEVSG